MWQILFLFPAVAAAFTFPEFSVQMAGITYCESQSALTESLSTLHYDWDTSLYNAKYDTNGYVAHNQTHAFIALRGSTSAQDWMDDLDVRQIPYMTDVCGEDCAVHEGFFNYAMAVKSQVEDALLPMRDKKWIFTAHSLGASVILLANWFRIQYDDQEIFILTFGSPRIGNQAFAAFTDSIHGRHSLRFTHYKDIVPHTPSPFRFQHVDTEVYEDENGELTVCRTECDICSAQFTWNDLSVKDHSVYLGYRLECLC